MAPPALSLLPHERLRVDRRERRHLLVASACERPGNRRDPRYCERPRGQEVHYGDPPRQGTQPVAVLPPIVHSSGAYSSFLFRGFFNSSSTSRHPLFMPSLSTACMIDVSPTPIHAHVPRRTRPSCLAHSPGSCNRPGPSPAASYRRRWPLHTLLSAQACSSARCTSSECMLEKCMLLSVFARSLILLACVCVAGTRIRAASSSTSASCSTASQRGAGRPHTQGPRYSS